MKTTKQTAVNSTLGSGCYKSPEVIISEMFNEGVLCISGPSNEGWTEETFAYRWALMDTMEDLLCNSIGGIIAYVFLLVYPYRHKGKFDINKIIDAKPAKEQKEAVTK